MGCNFRVSALLLGALLFPLTCLGAHPENIHLPPESKAILGIVILGKTTVKDFTDAVGNLGCAMKNENGYLSVDSECLKVAGNPKIFVLTATTPQLLLQDLPFNHETKGHLEDNEVIECVSMQFDVQSNWQNYFDSLRNLWGSPTRYRSSETSNDKAALWRRRGIVIELSEKGEEPTYLTYSTPARLDRLITEKEKADRRRVRSLRKP